MLQTTQIRTPLQNRTILHKKQKLREEGAFIGMTLNQAHDLANKHAQTAEQYHEIKQQYFITTLEQNLKLRELALIILK